MRRYSAAEAISPAWQHTLDLLWRPRNWPTLLKLTVVALFAEVSGFGFTGSVPPSKGTGNPAAAMAVGIFVLFFAVISFVIGVALLYIGSRLQFVIFDVVVRRYTLIAPIWKHHGRHTWRWIGLKLLYFLASFLVLLPILIPFVIRIMHLSKQATPGKLPPHFLSAFLSMLLPLFVVLIVITAVYWSLRDLVLPSIALEDVPNITALRRAWALLQTDTSAVLSFIGLRLIVSMGCGILCYIVIGIAAAISSIPFVAVGLALWLPLRHASHATLILPYVGIGILVAIYLVWLLLLGIVCVGTVLTFYQAWAAYFLGGRYPILGDLLEPPPVITPFTPPPSFPGPNEDDDTSGPNFPMDPVPVL